MRDATGTRDQVERELDRLQVRVARDPAEVGRALARRVLGALDERLALELVIDECRLEIPATARKGCRERDRVLHRELRPGADREVRRVHCISEQDDVPDVPRLVRDLREIEPERPVREELAAAQLVREQLLAEGQALLLVHLVEPGRAPHRLRALDDERRHALVERVRVGVEEPVLGLAEGEREGVEDVVGAEPDVLAALGPHLRPKVAELPHEAVRTVRADDEVGLRKLVDLEAELERDAQLAAPFLKDLEQPLARDRGERVAP